MQQKEHLEQQLETQSLHQEVKERIGKFQLTSDIFLSIVLEDPRACEEVVRILTGRDIRIMEVKSQYSIRQLDTRSVILDIFAIEEDGTRMTLEMHPGSDEDYLRRNRYIISSIDVNLLDKGMNYKRLPEIHAIYISNRRFGKAKQAIKKVVRSYNNVEDTNSDMSVENGIHEYYVSLKGKTDNKEQEDLLNYLMDTDAFREHEGFPNLIRRVRFYKEKREGANCMCELMNDLLQRSEKLGMERGIERGIERGEIQRSNLIIRNLVINMGITREEAIQMIGIPETEREQYLEMA